MNDRIIAYKAAGNRVIQLQVGDPDFATPPAVLDVAFKAMQAGLTHYGPSRGALDLRAAAASKLRRDNGLAVHLSIPAERFEALQERRRNQVSSGGCGLCGAEALDSAIRPVRKVEADTRLTIEALHSAFEALAAAQTLNRECGGLHAAAAVIGENLLVREDVGRHNALDKAIGAVARAGATANALLVTSRGSYELVHKTAEAGVGILAAVSAPTAYAVRLAEAAGITLIGFARSGRLTVYSHTWRVEGRTAVERASTVAL